MKRDIKMLELKRKRKIKPTSYFLELGITRYFLKTKAKRFKLRLKYSCYEENLYYQDEVIELWNKNKGE